MNRELRFQLKKLKKYLGDRPIRTKLNLLFAVLIILPLTLFGVITSVVMQNMQMEQIDRSSSQYLNQSVQGISYTLSEMENILISNLWNQELLKFLNEKENIISSPEEKNIINGLLRRIANTRKDIECLVLVKNSGEEFLYTAGGNSARFRKYVNRQEERQQTEEAQQTKTFWYGMPEDAEYVMGIRQIRDFETLKDIGWFYVFLKEETVRRQYEDLKTTPGSFFVVRDAKGQTVSCDGRDPLETAGIEEAFGSGLRLVRIENQKYYYKALEMDGTGWSIQEFTPEHEMMRDIYRMRLILASVISLLLGILLLLMNRFSASLTRPIRLLQERMLEVRNENFDVRVEVAHQDEIGELSGTFNMMTERIKRLIEEDYKSKLLLRETEFKFLRAQINPHFLYNTLDAISWKAAMGGNKDVSKMAVALGRILRWSISKSENLVMLKEEMQNVEDYLSIQKMRYGDSLSCVIAVEEPELFMKVPKMILQPLVENALTHGLESREGEKKLILEAESDEKILTISITDNGKGMSPERIREIIEGKVQQQKQHGVGLYNVHRRIQMNYGNEYGIRIFSELDRGTKIRIMIPREKQSDEHSGDDRRR